MKSPVRQRPRQGPISRLAALVGLAFLFGGAGLARAQPAAVEDLIREGVELRKQQKDHLALPLFQKAYDTERSGRTAGQLGLAEASLGYWISAERHLVEAIAATSNPWVARNEADLRRTLQAVQASIGEVEVIGTPAGAEVTVNGQVVGKLPLPRPVRVPEGAAQVSLAAGGHRAESTSALIEGGKRTRVTLSLEPDGAAAGPGPSVAAALPASPDGEAQVEGDEEEEAPVSSVRRRRRDSGSWVRPASWFAAAGAVAALAVGGYALSTQHSRVDEFDSYTPPGSPGSRPCNLEAADKGGKECQAILKRVDSSEKLAIAGFVAGGALAAAAIVGFIYSSGPDEGRRESDLALSVDPGNPATGAPFQLQARWSF